MACLASDQPLRAQLTKNGVIHAASEQNYGGFERSKYSPIDGRRTGSEYVPKRKVVNIACRSRWRVQEKGYGEFLVDNTEKITCKSCMKAMGMMDDVPLSEQRFVVRRKSDSQFFKNTSTRCTPWSDAVTDAFIFKRKHTAEDKCKMTRYEVDGRLYTYNEYTKLPRDNNGRLPGYKRKRIMNPDLEVRPVKIIVE